MREGGGWGEGLERVEGGRGTMGGGLGVERRVRGVGKGGERQKGKRKMLIDLRDRERKEEGMKEKTGINHCARNIITTTFGTTITPVYLGPVFSDDSHHSFTPHFCFITQICST